MCIQQVYDQQAIGVRLAKLYDFYAVIILPGACPVRNNSYVRLSTGMVPFVWPHGWDRAACRARATSNLEGCRRRNCGKRVEWKRKFSQEGRMDVREVENKSVWFRKSRLPEQGHPNKSVSDQQRCLKRGEGMTKMLKWAVRTYAESTISKCCVRPSRLTNSLPSTQSPIRVRAPHRVAESLS